MSVQSGLSLDLLAEELLSLIEGDSTVDEHLAVASNGGGLAVFTPPYIHLQQPPCREAVYNWTPAGDTIIKLVSAADVRVDTGRRQINLRTSGDSTIIPAGNPTQISVVSATGQCALEICEPIR